MLPELIFERFKNMLPPDEPLPTELPELYQRVKFYSDKIAGGFELSPEMMALLLVMAQDKTSTTVTVHEPEPVDDDAIFKKGTKVLVFFDEKMRNGEVLSKVGGQDNRYRVKIEDDKNKFRLIDADKIKLAE